MPFTEHNAVTVLRDGPVYFPAILEGIASARSTIRIEIYALWSGRAGDALVSSLCERAQVGVDVKLLVDAIGSRGLQQRHLNALLRAGVHLSRHNPFKLRKAHLFQRRTHRKLMLVDSDTVFLGGFNFVDTFAGSDRALPWLDYAIRVRGPAADACAAIFRASWASSTGEHLTHPPTERELLAGTSAVYISDSSPARGTPTAREVYGRMVTSARRRLWFEQMTFLPDAALRKLLFDAASRGVDIRVLLPGREAAYPILLAANRRRYAELIEHGIKIFEFVPRMVHAKLVLADDDLTLFTSANIDARSFRVNDEIAAVIRDRSVAMEIQSHIVSDLDNAELVSSGTVRRAFTDRVRRLAVGALDRWL